MPGALGAGGGFFFGKQVVVGLFLGLPRARQAVELELASAIVAPCSFCEVALRTGTCGASEESTVDVPVLADGIVAAGCGAFGCWSGDDNA